MLDVLELVNPLRERRVEHIRLADAATVLDPVAGANERRSVDGGDPAPVRTTGHRLVRCRISPFR